MFFCNKHVWWNLTRPANERIFRRSGLVTSGHGSLSFRLSKFLPRRKIKLKLLSLMNQNVVSSSNKKQHPRPRSVIYKIIITPIRRKSFEKLWNRLWRNSPDEYCNRLGRVFCSLKYWTTKSVAVNDTHFSIWNSFFFRKIYAKPKMILIYCHLSPPKSHTRNRTSRTRDSWLVVASRSSQIRYRISSSFDFYCFVGGWKSIQGFQASSFRIIHR